MTNVFSQAQATIIVPTIYELKVRADSPSHLWTLQTNTDDTIGTKKGTNVGVTQLQTGPLSNTYSTLFANSDSSYVGLADGTNLPTGNSNRTIEFWAKTTKTGSQVFLGYGDPSGGTQFVVYYSYNGFDFGVSRYGDDPGTQVTLPSNDVHRDGSWHHAVVRYTGSTRLLEFFIDGIFQGSTTFNGDANTTTTSARIGTLYYAGGFAFSGNLAFLAVYPTNLTNAQIINHALGNASVQSAQATALIDGPRVSQQFIRSVFSVTNPPAQVSHQFQRAIYSIDPTSVYGQVSHQFIRVIFNRATSACANVQAFIVRFPKEYGQANALIDSPHKQQYGQAQAKIVGSLTSQVAQAQAQMWDSYTQLIINSSPIGYWKMQEATGATTAVATIGTNGTYTNPVNNLVFGVYAPMPANGINRAVSNNNTAGYMATNASDTANTWTTTLWTTPANTIQLPTESTSGITGGGTATNGTGQNYVIWPEQRGADRGIGISVGTNGITVYAHGNSNIYALAVYTGTISSAMHHIAVVMDAQTPYIYLDGVLVRTGLTSNNVTNNYRSRTVLGFNSYGSYIGAVNEVAFFTTALNATTIAQQSAAGRPKAFAQAMAYIRDSHVFAQATCLIAAATYVAFGQAQADIQQSSQGYAQANAYISITNRAYAQANAGNAQIVITNQTIGSVTDHTSFVRSLGFSPTAGRLLVASISMGNSNSITSPPSGWRIITSGLTNPNHYATSVIAKISDGTETSVDFGFAGDISQYGYGIWEIRGAHVLPIFVNVDSINGTSSLTAINTSADSLILAIIHSGNTGVISSTALSSPFKFDQALNNPRDGGTRPTNLYDHFTSIQAFSNTPTLTGVSDALAIVIGWGVTPAQQYANAQAFIFKAPAWAQAQAWIKITNQSGSGQAQAMITNGRMHAQAQAYIVVRGVHAYAQAQTRIIFGPFRGYAQAQARMISFRTIETAQAMADIKLKTQQWAQAQATLIHGTRYSAYASAHATIHGIGRGYAQATVWIDTPFRYAQANALIDTPFRYSNTQAWIAIGGWGVANVRAKIERPWYRHALAQARILAFDYPQTAQVQALINQSMYTAQAQADIVNTFWAIGGAIATIIPILAFAHSQALMKGTITYKFAQTQADINQRYLTYAQAQAMMEQAVRHYAQALADIKAKTYGTGYALALITGKVEIGQAQAFIHASRQGYAQAEAQITRNTFYAQAQGYINAVIDGKVIDSRFLVNYNGYYLPGYAQSESYSGNMRINARQAPWSDGSLSEYDGLDNKELQFTFKVLGETYAEMKLGVQRAATILRSKRAGDAKLYVNKVDRYFLVKAKEMKFQAEATITHFVEYSVTFDAKPWEYGEQVYTVSGSGSLAITRGANEGGWTPAKVKVTGTDVTVSGYNTYEPYTGYFAVSGAVTNLEIDSDAYTATINRINKNKLMKNIDYAIYVGPGTTNFEVSGATEITISYQNRWY